MGISKFDDGIPDNPKHIAAGPIACWMWFCGVLYCRRGLTDGFIPKQKVPTLVVGLTHPFKHAATLVTVGLWDEAVGGYQVHDYLHWNPAKVTVEAYRQRDKDRKRKRFPDRIPDGIHTDVHPDSERIPDRNPDGIQTDSERRRASHAGATSKSESESKSEREGFRDESAREGPPPGALNPHAKATNLVNGAELRRHGSHAWCDYERQLCVSYSLHDEFKARSLKSDADLKAWYADTVAQFVGQPIGDDLFRFWRNSFELWIGAVTHAPAQRSPTAVEGNLRGLDEDMALLARGLPHGS